MVLQTLKRAITVVIGVPIVIFVVQRGGLLLAVLLTLVAILGLRELYVAVSGKYKHIHLAGYLFAVLYFLFLFLWDPGYWQFFAIAVFMIVVQASMVFHFKKLELKDCLAVVYGVLYIPVLLSFIFLVREHELGNRYVWLIFTSAFANDTFAYLVGCTIGKHRLVNTPSPKKSVEGLIGGVLGAAFVGGLVGFLMYRFSAGLDDASFIVRAAVISGVGGAFCSLGDMSASAVKRYSGIKDFGNLFPGHGGMIDRIDSIVFVAPVVYFAVMILTRV